VGSAGGWALRPAAGGRLPPAACAAQARALATTARSAAAAVNLASNQCSHLIELRKDKTTPAISAGGLDQRSA
jgi:hypothetical protein